MFFLECKDRGLAVWTGQMVFSHAWRTWREKRSVAAAPVLHRLQQLLCGFSSSGFRCIWFFGFVISWFRVSLAACSVLSLSVSVYFVWCSMTEKHFGSPPHVFMCAVKTLPDVLSTCTIGVVSIQRSLPVYLFPFSISLFIFLHMMLFNFTVFWLWNQTKYLNPTPPSFQTSSAAYSVFPSLRASWHQENKLSVHLFPYFTEYNKSEDLSLTHARFLHISPVYMILEYLSQ